MKSKRTCRECGEELQQSGRLTWYCPSCDVCPTCRCPRVDGFEHYRGCAVAAAEDEQVGQDIKYVEHKHQVPHGERYGQLLSRLIRMNTPRDAAERRRFRNRRRKAKK